jgi:hypothetical protein
MPFQNPNPNVMMADLRGQSGGGILTVVGALGLVLLLVQGSTWYRSNAGTKFLRTEKNKVLAMQMAEAGVEENIADLAKRSLRVNGGETGVSTYDHKPLDGGSYSSNLTTVATGSAADTVDLTSMGFVGAVRQTIQARLRLKKFLDSTRAILAYVEPDTTTAIDSASVADTAIVAVPPPNPAATPNITTTAAYAACMAGAAPKCNVCHLPLAPSPNGRMVLNLAKGFIASHNTHKGDYLTTDGTCDMYDTTYASSITFHTVLDTTFTIVDKTLYDTNVVVDTAVKVQVLSWR